MKTTLKSLAIVFSLINLAFVGAHAQLVSYTIHDSNGGGGNPVAPSIANSTTTTATNYTIGPGLSTEGTLGFGVDPSGGGDFATTLAGAESAKDYVTFTIAPTAGNDLSLTNVDFSGARFYNNGDDTMYATLESNVTGFGTHTAAGTGGTFNISGFLNLGPDISLNHTTFSDLTSPVVFRLYVYATDGKGVAASLPYDAETGASGDPDGGPILIDGSTAVTPEPSTYALMGLGLALLALTLPSRRPSRL